MLLEMVTVEMEVLEGVERVEVAQCITVYRKQGSWNALLIF